MGGIAIAPFLGMLPRTAPRLLGDGAAVDATNVILTSGEIRPLRQPLLVNTPSTSGPWQSVYRAENVEGGQKWLAWAKEVDVARGPLPAGIPPRYYWTGDGEPRYASYEDLPDAPFAVGVPRPKGAPTLTTDGAGTGATVNRVYVYTFYSALNEESADSPATAVVQGKVDDTWTISDMDAFPANAGTGTAVHAAGVTTFTNTGNHWLRAGDEIEIGGDKVLVTETPTNATFRVLGDYAADTAWARVAPWNTVGMKRRLYRQAGSTASFQLVDDDVGTSFNDNLSDSEILGDELISQAWDPPPPGLRGLRALPNGCLVGFVGTQLCYSEPLQPHAWPVSYRRVANFEIVGVEPFGSNVVVGTRSVPYMAVGVEPATVQFDAVQQRMPCLAKRGMVSVGDGVLYPTSYGMAYVGMKGAFIWSDAFFTRAEWPPLLPATMVAVEAQGRVYVRFGQVDGARGVLVFDVAEGPVGLTLLSDFPDEIYSDAVNGQMYLVDSEGIKLFDAGDGARPNYSWRSKDLHLSKPLNFGVAKVDLVSEMTEGDYEAEQAAFEEAVAANELLVANYAGLGALNGRRINAGILNGSNIRNIDQPVLAGVTFTLLQNGKVVHSRVLVADQRAFKLPSGFKADSFQVQLTGSVRVKSVKLAETMDDLKRL
ncbi:hypothetical protein BN948_01733 [Hydrogenophaga intermedia]|uniref:Uncharacterized protein n=1 Tax=Hydrogenophaga intermedia TaxID=65786 RepID=A0A1L1PH46_HYDIT|nr:hypothetical protein [Hydrogenophaga intermedia]CDN87313.1 hypothetical protein BN948_01733 [Hydrogenophaga intermedia]